MMCVLGLSGTTESSWASSLDHSLTVANWFESAGFFLFFFYCCFFFCQTFPLLLCSLDKILNHKQKKCKRMVKFSTR